MEEERINRLMNGKSELRKLRIKEMAEKERLILEKSHAMLLLTILGSRMQKFEDALVHFRVKANRDKRQNEAANLITANIKMYVYRKRRNRIRWAIGVICSQFRRRIRESALKRRHNSCDIIVDFVKSIQRINTFHGCLNLLIRGKEWKAYKRQVVLVQRHWREKFVFILSQAKLIDRQWQDEYDHQVGTKNFSGTFSSL